MRWFRRNDPPRNGPDGAGGWNALRRDALLWIGAALGGAASLGMLASIVTVIFGPIWDRPGVGWVDLGPVGSFPAGQVRLVPFRSPDALPWDGATTRQLVYVRRESGARFRVFAVNCTHLGCPLLWIPGAKLFMCPCHGGVFYADGTRAAGPPRREMYEHPSRVRNGRLEAYAGRLPSLGQPA